MNPGVLVAVGAGGCFLFALIFVVGFCLMRAEEGEKVENKPSNAKRLTTPNPTPLLPPPMSPNPGVLVAVGAGGFILFAIIFVVGFRLMRDEQDEKVENKPSNAKRLTAPNPTPLLPPPMSTTPSENAHEVLRVLRDNLTGRLVV